MKKHTFNLYVFALLVAILLYVSSCTPVNEHATQSDSIPLQDEYDCSPLEQMESCDCCLSESSCETIKNNRTNPFFFGEGVYSVELEGFFYPPSLREIRQSTVLTISELAIFDDGVLFTLQISQIDTSQLDDPYPCGLDYISDGFEYLGYFFVTDNAIYRRHTWDRFSEDEKIAIINAFNENGISALTDNHFDIVASEDGTERVNQGGWYSYITVDGDRRIFSFYHEERHHVTRHYERIVWERGKGIVHFVTGIGAMRNHVEFGINLYENYPDKRWVNGLWFVE